MTISENGQRKRISKHKVVVKQLMKQAMTGSTQALRIYFGLHQIAFENSALLEASRASDLGKYNDFNNLTDEELIRIAAGSLKDKE